MTPRQAIAYVRRHGVVLESAHVAGVRVPTLVDAIVGAPVGGNWWTHPQGKKIFWLTPGLGIRRLDAIQEIHTPAGRHVTRVRRFPLWVPPATKEAAKRITENAARRGMPRL